MTENIEDKVFVDVQIGGEIKSWELLQDLCENIRMYFYLNDPTFDGVEGIKLIAQQINGNAGQSESIHIQGVIGRDNLFSSRAVTDGSRLTYTAMNDLHAACVMGNLSYQILEANPGQEGYNTMITWEPGTEWDESQQFVDLVGEMEPGISLEDLRKAKAEGRTLEDITDKLGKVTTVAIRHNQVKMDESIYRELCDVLDNEQSTTFKI